MNTKSNKDLTVYLSKDRIDTRVKEIASQLSNKFSNEYPIIIGVLNGSFIFLADLVRLFDFDCEIDFVKANSYVGKESSGKVKLDLKKGSLEVIGSKTQKGGNYVITKSDHRIAMSMLTFGLAAEKNITIDDSSMIKTSFPKFKETMNNLNARISNVSK